MIKNNYVTLKDLAEKLGLDESNARKFAIRQGFHFKILDTDTNQENLLVLHEEDANILIGIQRGTIWMRKPPSFLEKVISNSIIIMKYTLIAIFWLVVGVVLLMVYMNILIELIPAAIMFLCFFIVLFVVNLLNPKLIFRVILYLYRKIFHNRGVYKVVEPGSEIKGKGVRS